MRGMSFSIRKIVPLIIVAVALTSCGDVSRPDFGSLTGGGGPKKFEDLVASAKTARDAGNTAEAEKLYNEAIEVCKKKFMIFDSFSASSWLVHSSSIITGLSWR